VWGRNALNRIQYAYGIMDKDRPVVFPPSNIFDAKSIGRDATSQDGNVPNDLLSRV
jgi:hypothetical protein